jgi:hypothetical protein
LGAHALTRLGPPAACDPFDPQRIKLPNCEFATRSSAPLVTVDGGKVSRQPVKYLDALRPVFSRDSVDLAGERLVCSRATGLLFDTAIRTLPPSCPEMGVGIGLFS